MNHENQALAKDLMNTDLVRLHANASIGSAVDALEESEIGGAPVFDEVGHLLGVLSVREVPRAGPVRPGRIDADRGDLDTVADWMNRRVVTIDPGATLQQVCRRMHSEHVDRVIVAHDGQVEGIVTSLDVVRCIATR